MFSSILGHSRALDVEKQKQCGCVIMIVLIKQIRFKPCMHEAWAPGDLGG